MTTEEKELLLKDISARLSYHLKLYYKGKYGTEPKPIILIDINNRIINSTYEIEGCKPYLRPLSSMTDKEKDEYTETFDITSPDVDDYDIFQVRMVDWLVQHHFDVRGLIDKGLAIEAPEGMYN